MESVREKMIGKYMEISKVFHSECGIQGAI